MATITLPLPGADAWVTVEHGTETARAYGLIFDDDADVIADIPPERYSGYCTTCILADTIDRAGIIPAATLAVALADNGHACTCD